MKLAGKQGGSGTGNGQENGQENGVDGGVKVVDFNRIRSQKMDEKRRKTERIFFQNLLGVYCVTGNTEVRQLQLVDVSEDGIAFLIPFDTKNPWPRESGDLPIRLYFTQDTYLPIQVRVVNSRPSIENGVRYVRYGCTIDQTLQSYETYSQFVRFLKSFSEQAHKDDGNTSVFYL
ncbi:MAG: hypothetical protein RJB38_2138 [Pseudomonadota bacterium]|jgi:hypothetical protein